MSDTLERMLRPQGLFQGMQPRPFDWQQAYAGPAQAQQPGPGQPPPGMPPAPDGAGYQAPGQFGQPPYAGGEYGATEWGTAQYGPGQYPPGDFGNGQYAQGQFGQPPFPPGQYPPTGQYGPGAPYGAGGQFGPGVPPGSDGRRSIGLGKLRVNLPKGPLVPALIGAVLVVVVVVAVVLAAQGGSPPAAGTAGGGTPTATASGVALAEKQAASQLAGLLAASGNDRSDVNAAAGNVDACKDLAPSAREFTKAASNRRKLLSELAQLPSRSALPPAMVSDIKGAWQASATVDEDLAKWASKAATSGCRKGNSKNPNANSTDPSLNASFNFDSIASNDKTAFVGLWNPLARKDSLPTYTVDQL